MNYEAEQNVIGSLFMDFSCIDRIYSILEPQMFSSELLGMIYLEFRRAYDERYDINPVIICQKLQNSRYPGQIISEEIKKCLLVTTTSAAVRVYADILVKEYKAKCLNQILNSTLVNADSIDQCIDDLISRIEALKDDKQQKGKTLPVIVQENKDSYFKEDKMPRVNLGFDKLDDMLGGLEGGDVVIIGARPAVGKSAFATQITSHLAGLGKKVGFFNLEMKEKQIYERFVVSESGIGLTRLRRAVRFLGDEKGRFDKANEALEKKDNIVITTGSKSVSEIRAESRHAGYDVIVIDYMQLLKTEKTYRGNRYAEVGAISKALKALAMELNIPIIELSQLNRLSVGREDKEPTMDELRESGDIEQDASVIILLWNSSQEDSTEKGCKIEKQRQGKTGKIKMRFNGDMMRFEEIESSNEDWRKLSDDADIPFT